MNKILITSLTVLALFQAACSKGMNADSSSADSGNGSAGVTTTTTMPVVTTTTLPTVTTTTLPPVTTTTTTTTRPPVTTTTTLPPTTTTTTTTTTMPPPVGTVTLTTPITVQDYPAGTGPANLVSNGMPFRSGVLTDLRALRVLDGTTEVPIATKVLARWPNNSIRVVLVQFSAVFSTATKIYTLFIGVNRATTDLALTPVSFKYPRKIALLSATYLSQSLVVWEQKALGASGQPAWDQKQLQRFSAINTEPNPANTCANTDMYYDTISTSYQMYARTGSLETLINGRRWAYHHRVDQINLTGANIGHGKCGASYIDKTRYTFVDGLVRDYFFWGDEESLRVAGIVVDNFYVPHSSANYYKAPNTRGFWTEREAAFAQLGLIAYYEGTNNQAYLNLARDRVHSLYSMQQGNNNGAWLHNLYDHDPDEGCPVTSYGSSPFMSGLLSESLIRYHKLTKDPIAASSITYAATYLRNNVVATGENAGRGFIYLGCAPVYVDSNPDIDGLIIHLFGYAYRLSNYTNTAFYNLGMDTFNVSVADGFASAFKQFNQQFRSSGSFLAYIDPNVKGLE